VLIYEAGHDQLLARINLAFEGNEPLPDFTQAGSDVLIGLRPAGIELAWEDQPWVATRIRFRNGEWRAEQALLSQNPSAWQRDFRLMAARETDFWFSTTEGVFSVAWPDGASSISFAPVQIIDAETDFERSVLRTGEVLVSPSGDSVAWVDSRAGGEVRVVSAPPSVRTRE
jgi:hypothetical protein